MAEDADLPLPTSASQGPTAGNLLLPAGGWAPATEPPLSRAEEWASASQLAGLGRENEVLHSKLVRMSRALHAMASDLAAARSECRKQQQEIATLRAELARRALA